MVQDPVDMNLVTKRRLDLICNNDAYSMPLHPFESIARPLKPDNVEKVIIIASSSTENANNFWLNSFELFDELCKEGQYHPTFGPKIEKIFRYILNELLPKLKTSRLDSVMDFLNKSDNIDTDHILSIQKKIDSIKICDRILNNSEKINKRFNINKFINNSNWNDLNKIITELCEFIDTYNTISDRAKYNICLENIKYALYSNGINVVNEEGYILECITDYFMSKYPVITDTKIIGLKSVAENNKCYSIESSSFISYLLDKKEDTYYSSKLDVLSEKCDSIKCKNIIRLIKEIKSESDASKYIQTCFNTILENKISDDDQFKLCKSIFYIPLVTDINKQFINMEFKLLYEKFDINIEYDNVSTAIQKMLNDNTLIQSSIDLNNEIKLESDILSNYYKEPNLIDLLESEEYTPSDDVRDLIKKFKGDQEKSEGRFKNLFKKLYTKDPNDIIDETPSIMSCVRAIINITTFSINPVLGAVTTLTNTIISHKINQKNSQKFYEALKEEKEKIDKKIDDDNLDGEEKERYKSYSKCLDKCIDKVKDYNDNISDFDDSDFGDFNLDFDLESAIMDIVYVSESLDRIHHIDKSNIMESIEDNIEKIVKTDLEGFSNIIVNSGELNIDEYCNILKEYSKLTDDPRESTNIILTIDNIYSNKIRCKSLAEEYYYREIALETVIDIINEGFDINNIKLAFEAFKKKAKNFTSKQKEIWQRIDAEARRITDGIQKALREDRREAIIKGTVIPSFSRCIKYLIAIAGVGIVTGNPVSSIITAVGMLGVSKALTKREKQLIYDEIDTELKVLEKQISIAESDQDMNQYRFLLQYQKKLMREKQRIKYGMAVKGQHIPNIND